MTKYVQGKDGKFAGSVGDGNKNVPQPSDIPHADSAPKAADPTPPYADYAKARAASRGRQLVLAKTVKAARTEINPSHTHVSVTLRFPSAMSRAEIEDRLNTAGVYARIRSEYGDNTSEYAWIVSRDPLTDEIHAISPLTTNDDHGWKALRRAEKGIRGSWRKRGPEQLGVEVEAGTPDRP